VILVSVVLLLANAGDLSPRGLFPVLYLVTLALPFILVRRGVVGASRWGLW
jgi:hypothetical protein